MKVKCLNCGHEFETTEIEEDDLGTYCICEECGSSFDVGGTTRRIDWMEMIVNFLPGYLDTIWSDGEEILVTTEDAANKIADAIKLLYQSQGEDILVNTGYYNLEEDKRDNVEDKYTGYWYVSIDQQMKTAFDWKKEELKMKKSTTIKTKTRGYVWIDTCFTLDHGWETMVFSCDENGNVSSWLDLDYDIYATESQASEGHEEMIEKWKNM